MSTCLSVSPKLYHGYLKLSPEAWSKYTRLNGVMVSPTRVVELATCARCDSTIGRRVTVRMAVAL